VVFPPSSRYANAATYQASLPNGGVATALVLPAPRSAPPIGFHPRAVGDRLDLIAVKYLDDPTGFWRLCEANNALVAGALEQRALIAVPARGAPA
jgi:hypothetical protein